MKTNKFRVWDGKKFLAADSFCLFPEDDGTFTPRKLGAYGSLEDVPNAVIQQYTGLKDCSGKDIYEGDIIKFIHTIYKGEVSAVVYTGFVEFSGSLCAYALNIISNDRHNGNHIQLFGGQPQVYEVIGNIFENPELLQ